MALDDNFNLAKDEVTKLKKRPGNKDLLQLYAFFKQGTEGNVSSKRPGMLDIAGRAKWDAWKEKEGVPQDQAKQQYIDYVEKLKTEIGIN